MQVIPVRIDGELGPSDDLAALLLGAARLEDGDVVVAAQKAVSKCEGRTVELAQVEPSLLAEGIASQYGKDPRVVELVLSESERIVRMGRGVIITRTRGGLVCANAGVDESNVPEGRATLLPEDPDASAEGLRRAVEERSGRRVAVLVSDTFGRPFRTGQANCAIGAAGIGPLLGYAGTRDSFGRVLRVTEIAVADELCAAAELVTAKASGCPLAVIRGYRFDPGGGGVRGTVRGEDDDLFR